MAEMAAFLGELVGGRRDVAATLRSLARAAGSKAGLELARQKLTSDSDALRALLKDSKLRPETAAAFAYLADAELGNASGQGFSDQALAVVARLFELEHDGPEPSSELLEKLSGTQKSRSALDVLEDLGHDLDSKRTLAFAEALRPRLPAGHFRVSDEHRALVPLLSSTGYRVNPHTVMGLCLFVDVEVGNISKEHLASLAEAADTFDSSMYAMVATAGAFGLPLVGLAADDPEQEPEEILESLIQVVPDGLLACFHKPGEEGRWWELLKTQDDARRALSLGLDFVGIVLGRAEGDVSSAGLTRLDDRRLLGWSDALSRDTLRLRWMRSALRRVLAGPVPRVSVRSENELALKVADFWLATHGRTLTEGLVESGTLEKLAALLGHDHSLDFLFHQSLAEMLRDDVAPAWASMRVLHAMCRSDRIQLEGAVKHYDPPRLATLVHQRAGQCLTSEEPRVRELTALLCATEEMVTDANARMLVEFELSELLRDPEPAVVRASVEGLVRLCLREAVPLPALLRLGKAELALGKERLKTDEVEAVLEEMKAWVEEQSEKDELARLDLPFTDADGNLQKEKALPLAELMAALVRASREDSSRKGHRYYLLVPAERLRRLGQGLLESFRKLARSLDKSVHRMATTTSGADLLLEYKVMLEQSDEASLPVLGGRSEPTLVYHFAPYVESGVWTVEPDPPNPPRKWRSLLFAELVELARRIDLKEVRLVRLVPTAEDALAGLDTFEPSFTTVKKFWAKQMEVLQVRQARFVPFLLELAATGGSEDEQEWTATQAVLALLQGGERALGWRRFLERAGGEPEPEAEPPREIADELRLQLAQELAVKFGMAAGGEERVAAILKGEWS